MAVRLRVCVETKPLTSGDPKLLAHEIDARCHLGNGMLDLEAGIDFQEGNNAFRMLIGSWADQVFHGSSTVVAGFLANPFCRGVNALALRLGQKRCRSFLDKFLKAALQRAVASPDDDDIAVLVSQYLCFNVAGFV